MFNYGVVIRDNKCVSVCVDMRQELRKSSSAVGYNSFRKTIILWWMTVIIMITAVVVSI